MEFAFNSMCNRSTGLSPFEIVYTKPSKHALDLVPLSKLPGLSMAVENMAERVQQIQASVHQKLEQANDRYKAESNKTRWAKVFQEGDLVMAHLHKNHFPTGTYGKLKSRKDLPFWITRKINDNSLVVELLDDMSILNTFNVSDLFEYHPDDPLYADDKLMTSFWSRGDWCRIDGTIPYCCGWAYWHIDGERSVGRSKVNECLLMGSSKDQQIKVGCDSTDGSF